MKNSKIVLGKEIFWDIDLKASASVQKWVNKFPERFVAEVEEMEQFFPRWFLTVAKEEGSLISCSNCGNTLVPFKNQIVCIACKEKTKLKNKANLAWVGHLPILVSGRKNLLTKLKNINNHLVPLVELDEQKYLLVPITIVYPEKWPLEQPNCYYHKEFFEVIGKPTNSYYLHLLAGNKMCLFHYNEWDQISVCKALKQRVVNHLLSTIKIADGITPNEAFIEGR